MQISQIWKAKKKKLYIEKHSKIKSNSTLGSEESKDFVILDRASNMTGDPAP